MRRVDGTWGGGGGGWTTNTNAVLYCRTTSPSPPSAAADVCTSTSYLHKTNPNIALYDNVLALDEYSGAVIDPAHPRGRSK
jgi:hypothetical protein